MWKLASIRVTRCDVLRLCVWSGRKSFHISSACLLPVHCISLDLADAAAAAAGGQRWTGRWCAWRAVDCDDEILETSLTNRSLELVANQLSLWPVDRWRTKRSQSPGGRAGGLSDSSSCPVPTHRSLYLSLTSHYVTTHALAASVNRPPTDHSSPSVVAVDFAILKQKVKFTAQEPLITEK